MKPDGGLVLLSYTYDSLELSGRFVTMIRFMSRFHRVPCKHIMSMGEIRAMAESTGSMIEELRLIGGKVEAIYLLGHKPV